MKNKLIGKKIRGFKFYGLDYNSEMDRYINKVGIIIDSESEFDNYVRVRFENSRRDWYYPLDLVLENLDLYLKDIDNLKYNLKNILEI
jgi:hypothetical protein